MTWEQEYNLKAVLEKYAFHLYEYAELFGGKEKNLKEWDELWNNCPKARQDFFNEPFDAINKCFDKFGQIDSSKEVKIFTSFGTILTFPKDGWLVLEEDTGRGCWVLIENNKDAAITTT